MEKRALILMLLVAFSLTGCTQFTGYMPSSHLTYPNANVTPIGPGKATSETSCSWVPQYVTSDMQEQTLAQAIRSRNGDVLLDYASFTTNWFVPLLYVTIYCTKYSVEGTVAKQEIGYQKLQ